MSTLRLRTPDDFHLHLRDGAELGAVARFSAAQFGRALVMPNLREPIRSTAAAAAYRDRIHAALEGAASAPAFAPLMSLYLTEDTTAAEVERAKYSGFVYAFKCYPNGATTHSDAGVRSMANCSSALEAMQALDFPLLLHGEVTSPDVDIFDREREFLGRELDDLRRKFPRLRVVLEHITTAEAVDYVQHADTPLVATITAHHLLFNRSAMFERGLQPHAYCLPVLKRERHRQAVLDAATSGDPRFFLGTDSAPHARARKEAACGCAGSFTAPHALALYAEAFEQRLALDKLEDFASSFGARFYGLPLNDGSIELMREPVTVEHELPFPGGSVVPFRAGCTLPWRVMPRTAG